MTSAPTAPPPRLWPIAWPLFVELLLGIAVGVVGTALAARLSDASGAAFALAHHVFGALFILFRIIGAGVGVVVTQALGAGRRDEADATARAALGASTWMGGVLAAAAALFATPLLGTMQAPAEVLPLAATLLVALAPALLLDAWNASMAAVMRAHLHARDSLMVMVVMHTTQLMLVAPLMFGLGAWPGLGLPGFALALLVARLLALGLHRWLWRRRLHIRLQRGDWWQLHRGLLGPVARIGLPGAAENMGWRLAFMASVAVVGSLGTQALATHAYAQQAAMVVLLFALATGLSVEVLVATRSAPVTSARRVTWCAARCCAGGWSAWRWPPSSRWPGRGCCRCSRRTRRSSPPPPCCCGGRCGWSPGAPSTWW